MKYNRIAYPGEFTHTQGPFKMDLGVFASILNQFKTRRAKPIVDFDHFSEGSASKGDGDKIAAGHVEDLKIMNGDLYAAISWTAKAKQKIVDREYSYLSPAIIFNGVGSDGKVIPARLSSIGLVNRPFLHELEPVLASDNGSVAICCSEIGETEIAELATAQGEEHAEELVTLADLNVAVIQATEPLAVQLQDKQLELDVADAQVLALQAQVKTMADQNNDSLVESRYQLYRESRKLGPRARATMKLVLASDPALFDAEYPPIANNVAPWMLRTLSSDPGSAATLASVKTVPTLASLIDRAKEQHPGLDYDAQFSRALSEYNAALGMAA